MKECNGLVLNCPCPEQDCLWSPYLGCWEFVSMTVTASFVRGANMSTLTSFFSFSFPSEMYQEGSGGCEKKSRHGFFCCNTRWASRKSRRVLIWLKSDLDQIIAFTSPTWLSDRKSPLHWNGKGCPGYPQVTMPWHHRAMTLHGHTWQCATESSSQGFARSNLPSCFPSRPVLFETFWPTDASRRSITAGRTRRSVTLNIVSGTTTLYQTPLEHGLPRCSTTLLKPRLSCLLLDFPRTDKAALFSICLPSTVLIWSSASLQHRSGGPHFWSLLCNINTVLAFPSPSPTQADCHAVWLRSRRLAWPSRNSEHDPFDARYVWNRQRRYCSEVCLERKTSRVHPETHPHSYHQRPTTQ